MKGTKYKADISLLRLSRVVPLHKYINVASLPDPKLSLAGKPLIISGYGYKKHNELFFSSTF